MISLGSNQSRVVGLKILSRHSRHRKVFFHIGPNAGWREFPKASDAGDQLLQGLADIARDARLYDFGHGAAA